VQHGGKFEIVALNAPFDNAPAAIDGFCTQGPTKILFPFLQDTNAADVRAAKYMGVKHDIFIIGPDTTIRREFRNFALDPTNSGDADLFKAALIAAMP
jgi:hypothetical protein